MPSAGVISVVLKGDMRNLASALNQAQKKLDVTSRKMRTVGANMTAGLTLPIGLIGGATIKMASTFDTEMTKIETLVGVARDQVDGWRKDILKMGPALGRGPTELGRALFVVTSAGERTANALKIVEFAGKAAAAGLGDTADVARTVTAAMQAYGSENLSAERATNILLKTVREGNLEASELAGTLGRVIGVASAMGVEFEEVGGFIATFTRLGVQSAEAVTALRSFMSAMLKPSKDARKTLVSLGTSIEEVRARIKDDGLADALLFLMDKTEGSDDALASIIPNVRALAGVLGTAKAQPEALRQIMASLKDEADALGPAFERVGITTAHTMAQFKAQAESMAISIGDQLAPAFSKLLKAATPVLELVAKLVTGFSKLPGWVQTTVVALVGLAAVAGPLIYVSGAMIAAWGALLPVLATVATAATAAGAAVLVALGPALLIALGVAALVAGIALIVRHIRKVKDTAEETEQSLQAMAREGVENLEEYDRLSKGLKGLGTAMKALIPLMEGPKGKDALKAWKMYEEQFIRIRGEMIAMNEQAGIELPVPEVPQLPGAEAPDLPGAVDDKTWDEIWRERVDKELGFMDLLQQAGANMLQERKAFLTDELRALREQGKGQSELAMELEQDWLDAHQGIMDKAAERLAVEKALEEERRAFMLATGQLTREDRLAQIEEELGAVKAGSKEELALQQQKYRLYQQLVRGQIGTIQAVAGATKESIIAALQALLDKMGEIGEEFPEIKGMIDDAMDAAGKSGLDAAQTMEEEMGAAGQNIGENFVRGIIGGSFDMGDALKSAMIQLAQVFVIKAFKVAMGMTSPSKVAMGWGENIGEGLAQGIEKAVPRVSAAMGQMRAAVIWGVDMPGMDQFSLAGLTDLDLSGLGRLNLEPMLTLPPVGTITTAPGRGLSEPLDIEGPTEGLLDFITSLQPSDPIMVARSQEFQRTIGETLLELETNGWRVTRMRR